jgi:hypothetical protein
MDKRIGNKYWMLADPEKIGRPPMFKNPKDLLQKAIDYFEWIDENPITTKRTTVSDKGVFVNQDELQRPYTWHGLYAFLGVCNLDHYKTKKEFSDVLTHIDNIMRSQKFEGASAGIFNANIIARDIGLKEQTDVTTQGDKLGVSTEELRLLWKESLKHGHE